MLESNWAGNYVFVAKEIFQPVTVGQLQEHVAASARVRALGTRHSFNGIADSAGTLVNLQRMDPNIEINVKQMTVSCGSAVSYGQLASYLQARGFALHNLGSLPHISVIGACATGTHGSGDSNGNLSSAVVGLEIVSHDGSIIQASRETCGESFHGMVVALGALGIVTRVTLSIQPSYQMRQDVYLNLPWNELAENFTAITSSTYSVNLFTNWDNPFVSKVWLKSRLESDKPGSAAEDFFGATLEEENFVAAWDNGLDNLTDGRGVPGTWNERLPHFKADKTPSFGDELQSEYFVDRSVAVAAFEALRRIGPQVAPHLNNSEIRTVAQDSLWLSPAYKQDAVGLHFTWKNQPKIVEGLVRLVEETIQEFAPRPHWGKIFTLGVEQIAPEYARMDDFRNLVETYDPTGKFHNPYLEMNVFPRPGVTGI